MNRRANSKSAESVITRYAALKALVEIANQIKGVERDTAKMSSLLEALARIQQLVGTPAELRAPADYPLPDIFWRDGLEMRRWLSDRAQNPQPSVFEGFTETLWRASQGCDLRRLRLCPQCGDLFVAVPSDKTACSPQCASAQRVHRFLGKNIGYYTRKSRDNRATERKRRAKRERLRRLMAAR